VRFAQVIVAAMLAGILSSVSGPRPACGQETIVMEGPAGAGVAHPGQDVRRPPWHRSVQGEACGSGHVCRAHGMFHADACGQLRHHGDHHGCVTRPSCFPRLQGWWTDGIMPTPPPLELPRCHQCGAVIAGGL